MFTPVDFFFSFGAFLHSIGTIRHQHVDEIWTKYSFNDTESNGKIGTYMIFNKITGHFYVGSGILNVRKATHLRDLKSGTHWNKQLRKAFREANGEVEFHSIEMSSRKEALAYEQHLIDYFWDDQGFCNLARYVETPTLGVEYTQERRQKIRKNNLQMWSDPKHKEKVFTPEANRKRSASLRGNKYALGYRHTQETKEKHSLKMKELCQLPETRERLQKQMTEYFARLSPEQKLKRSEKQRQIALKLAESEEYRQKLSDGVKASWTVERRKRASETGKEISNREEIKEFRRANTIAKWQDPEYRDKVTSRIIEASNRPEAVEKQRERALEYFNRPEVRKATSERVKRLFDDPEHREKNRVRMDSYNVARSKAIVVDGVSYSSLREASRKSGIARNVIKNGLKKGNPRFVMTS